MEVTEAGAVDRHMSRTWQIDTDDTSAILKPDTDDLEINRRGNGILHYTNEKSGDAPSADPTPPLP